MFLEEILTPEDFLVGFDPPDKWAAIERMMDHLVRTGRCPAEHADELRDAVLTRERSMSTGMERGIAIPHAAVDGIERVVACIGVVPEGSGLAFDSVDGRPTNLVVLLLIPRSQKLLHIRTLAEVARVLGKDSVREGLYAAEDGAQAMQALLAGEAAR